MKIDGNQPIGEDIDKKEDKIEEESVTANGGGEGKEPIGREYKIDATYYFEDEEWFNNTSAKTEEDNRGEKKPDGNPNSEEKTDLVCDGAKQEKTSSNYFGDDFSCSQEKDFSASGYFGEKKSGEESEFKNPNYFGENLRPIYREEDIGGKNQNKGLGIASMILGIASIVGCCLEGMAIVPAVLAIIFASVRMKTKSDGCAVAGLITGIIGIILNIVMILVLVFAIVEGMTPPDYTETESAYELITRLLR